jgi:putative serine protease PepD
MKGLFAGLAGGFIGTAMVVGALLVSGVIPLDTVTTTTPTQSSDKTTTAVSYQEDGLTPQQIYDDSADGVVEIVATFAGQMDIFGQSSEQQGIGSGFVVDEDGYILTNAHVVSNNGQLASDVQVIFNEGGKQTNQVSGTIVGADDSTDVAVIKVDPAQVSTLDPIALGDSSSVQVGERVVAIGNPLGLEFSLSSGIVSATDREMESPNGAVIGNAIQTDASINPGNSGGPLINASGEVIGINEQIATQSGGNEGIGFAVPINTAVKVMEQLKSGTLQQDDSSQGWGDQGYGDQGQQVDPGQIW